MVTLWLSDLRHSLRTLRREPLSSFAIVLTLGLGLGVNAAVFSFVEAVLLRPLPAHEPERLVVLWESDLSPRRDLIEVSLPNFLDWRRDARELEEMAAMGTHDWGYVLLGEGEPARVPYRAVSASFFDTLRVAPLLGRTFLPEDDTPGAPRVIIISYGFWQTRLGGDEAAIGRRLLSRILPSPSFLRSSASCRGRFNSRWARKHGCPPGGSSRRSRTRTVSTSARAAASVSSSLSDASLPKALSTWRRAS